MRFLSEKIMMANNYELNRENIELLFESFSNKDIEKVMSVFDNDSIFIDAHYPEKEMIGAHSIRRGLSWSINNMSSMKFTILNLWISEDKASVEVFAEHKLKIGLKLNFKEVFIIEIKNQKIKRFEAFLPYPPFGFVNFASKLIWKIFKPKI